MTLGPLESVSAFLNEPTFFGALLEAYEGAVELISEQPVAVTSLIQEATGEVATFLFETPAVVGELGPAGHKGDKGDQDRKDHRVIKETQAVLVLRVAKGTKGMMVHPRGD